MNSKPIVLLFSDDSTLIFACRMRDALRRDAPGCRVQMVWYYDENALSHRQLQQHLPEGPDLAVTNKGLTQLIESADISALVTSRVYRPLSLRLKAPQYRWAGDRPCIIAFLGGLDFFATDGFVRRAYCDGVFLFPKSAVDTFHKATASLDVGWQQVDFGHPAATLGLPLSEETLAARKDIFFFTQAISPLTHRSRLHMLEILVALAEANPERNIYIKLRHLPHENQSHLHVEKYNYPDLLKSFGPVPDNLRLTDMHMDEALSQAAIGITCTSTAALDVIRAGVPCMVYLDYVDAYRDPLAKPMRRLFDKSNLITPLEQLLELTPNSPDPDWLANMLCPDDLGTRVVNMIEAFAERPLQMDPPHAKSRPIDTKSTAHSAVAIKARRRRGPQPRS